MRLNSMKTLLLVSALAIGGTFVTGCPGGEGVSIRDEGLQAAIRRELGLAFGTITVDDMLTLRELDARNLAIRDLDGLEEAKNLLH